VPSIRKLECLIDGVGSGWATGRPCGEIRPRTHRRASLRTTVVGAMEDTTENKRIRPHQWVIGIGTAVAIFTAASGIAAAVFDQESDSEIHRTVFGNISTPVKVVFYSLIPVIIIWGAWEFSKRVKNWGRGAPDNRATTAKNVERRAKNLRAPSDERQVLRRPWRRTPIKII